MADGHQQWVVLDAMGVVFEVGDDVGDLLVPYVQRRNADAPVETIERLYRAASLGEIPSREFWAGVGLGRAYPDVERDYLDTCLTLDPDFLQVASELAPSYSLAMLSNDVAEWSAHLRARFSLDEAFAQVVISGEVGVRKPDARIYEILLRETGAPATDCLFVDDRPANLRPAADAGMKTILFDRDGACSRNDCAADGYVGGLSELPGVVDKAFEAA